MIASLQAVSFSSAAKGCQKRIGNRVESGSDEEFPVWTTTSLNPDSPLLIDYTAVRPSVLGVIPEIDIWRVANLMLKRYGSNAGAKSARRVDDLWDEGDTA